MTSPAELIQIALLEHALNDIDFDRDHSDYYPH